MFARQSWFMQKAHKNTDFYAIIYSLRCKEIRDGFCRFIHQEIVINFKMIQLPESIKTAFLNMMSGNTAIRIFEQWVYAFKDVELMLPEDDYLKLISFDYKKNGARFELFNLLNDLIGSGEFETWELINLLTQAKVRDNNLPGVLEKVYDLYFYGYSFLNTIGLGFGLKMLYLPAPYKVEHWAQLNATETLELVKKLPDTLEIEIDKVLRWLNNGEIVLTSKRDIYDHYTFIDNRSDDQKTHISQYGF